MKHLEDEVLSQFEGDLACHVGDKLEAVVVEMAVNFSGDGKEDEAVSFACIRVSFVFFFCCPSRVVAGSSSTCSANHKVSCDRARKSDCEIWSLKLVIVVVVIVVVISSIIFVVVGVGVVFVGE